MKMLRHTETEIAFKLAEADVLSPVEQTRRIAQLELENSRLRRLVTDLLLEKMKIEEGMQRDSTTAIHPLQRP